MEKKKKPFWKKWWFWVMIVIVLFIAIGSTGDSDKDKDKDTQNPPATTEADQKKPDELSDGEEKKEDEQKEEEQKEKDSYGVGEPATLKDVTVTLENVTESEGQEYTQPTEGNVFLLCEFTIDNQSSKELTVSSVISFDAYVDSYAVSQSFSGLLADDNNKQLDGNVGPGKKMNGVIAYEVPADWSEFEINFEPNVWSGKKLTFLYQK